MSGSPNHARFEQIRAYINAQAVHDHVTVVDWHAASGLADGDAAVERLMPIYYNITSVNAAAGTFLPAGGDAIHTNNLGYAILYSLLCQITGVSPDGRSGRTASAFRMLALRRTPLVHPAVPPNAPALAGMASLARDLPLITGEVARGIVGGVSRNPYSDRDAPLWFCPDVINYAAVANDYILAGGLSDEFGPYRQISGGSPYGAGYVIPGVGTTPVPMTLTVIVGPGGGSVRFSNASATAYLPLDIDGGTMTPTLTTQLPNDTDKPMVYHLTTSGVLAASHLVLSGNMRGVYLTPTTWPCIAGKEYAKARQQAPVLRLGEDIDASKVIDGQVYRTLANGKRLTQRAIGKVWRPLENRWSGLYTLLNRADAEVLEMVPNGTLTANAFDERLGGITRTTSANPSFAEAKVAADLSNRAFAAADAGKRWTISGQHLAAGLRIQLYAGSNNTYLGLALDGTWVNHSGAHSLAPNLLSGAYSDWRNRGIAISFDLPDAAMLDGRNWGLRLYQNGGGAGTMSEWTAAEGGMALV
ncbi:hypothetical protein [Gemmobacter sp. 24YEA27]|uniref:hypothetical protein n=1 Tax=Gemmobacter sp. 24YEA27 TaxID=3040672 RepID=UPI0024B3B861|nr:hypothetical protein [Gemmobacter sp. 24YEA27]